MRCRSDVSRAFAYFHFLERPVLQTQPSGLIRIVGAPRTAIFHARQATKWAHRDDKIENLDSECTLFAERALRNIGSGTAASVRLDVARPDHLTPLLGFVGDEPAEVRR